MALSKDWVTQNNKLSSQRRTRLAKLKDDEDQAYEKFKQAAEEQKATEVKENKGRGFLERAKDALILTDGGKSWTTEEADADESKKNVAEQTGDLARNFLGNTAKAINTAAEGARETVELGRALTARATGNKEAERAAVRRGLSEEDSLLEEGRGLLGVGGVVDQEELQDYSAGDLTKDIVGSGLGTAGEIAPGSAALKGASLARRTARAAGEGATLGAAGAAGSELLDEDGFDAGNVAEGALFGGVLGGAADAVGSRIAKGRADDTPAPVNENAVIDDSANQLADELAAPTPDEQLALPERASGSGARTLDEVDTEIQELQQGTHELASDPTAAGNRFRELQAEREAALRDQATNDFVLQRDSQRETVNRTPEEIQRQIDEINGGNIPENAYLEAPPVSSVDDVANDTYFPKELRDAAQDIANDRQMLSQRRADLMDAEEYDIRASMLDQSYQERAAAIAEMPPIRQEREMALLEDDYANQLDELDKMRDVDAEEIAEIQNIERSIINREERLIQDANIVQRESPEMRQIIDEDEVNSQIQQLNDELATTQKFTNADEITSDLADSPDPVRVADSSPEAYPALRETANKSVDATPNPDFKNVGAVKQSLLGLMSPSRILEKMGLRDVHTNIVTATSKMNQAIKGDMDQIATIGKALKGNDTLATQVVDYLEGNRSTLSATDTETAQLIRTFLDEKRKVLSDLGYKTMDDYFPHMYDPNSETAVRLFKSKGASGDIKFGNLKERKGGGDDFSRDIVDVLATYSQSFNKKVHLEPSLKPLEDIKLQNQVTQAEVDWVNDYINQLKGTNAGSVEKAFNSFIGGLTGKQGSNYYRNTLGTQRMISATATMGLNPGTAIRNMTQVVNTVAGIGPKHSLAGSIKGYRMLRAGRDSPEWQELMDAGIFDAGIGKNYNDELDNMIYGLSKGGSTVQKATNVMMAGIRGTDIALRTQAYAGAKSLGLARGMSEDAAKKFAIEKVVDTQFLTSRVDMPTKLNGPGVRSLTQLATFSAKQAEYLANVGVGVVKKDGKWHLDPKNAGNVFAAVVSAYAATEALKPLIGFNEKEWVPFYDQLAPLLPGEDGTSGTALYRSPLVRLLFGDDKSKIGLIEAIQNGEWEEFAKDNWSQIIPAGTQIKKTDEGSRTTDTGVSLNEQGKVRFLQDMGLPEQVQAGLFGQYATQAGQEWIREGFPTLSDSQSNKVLSRQNRKEQERFADFYTAMNDVTGRQDAIDAVKEAAQAGDANKAMRLSEEYNQRVQEAANQYMQQYGDIPEELRDELLKEKFINTEKTIKSVL